MVNTRHLLKSCTNASEFRCNRIPESTGITSAARHDITP